jgi:phosphatidylinositol 4-kinase B
MYAHEDVFQNNILDRAFPIQGDKVALSFYAPQLLCFLLHNAYLSTGKLERWILERCKTDLQFAHRCFWFLRSWCLQGGIFRSEEQFIDDDLSGIHSLNSAECTISSLHSLTQDSTEELHFDRSFSAPDLSNLRDLVQGPTEKDLEKSRGIKFHTEERKCLEKLLGKIVSNGEFAARQLETHNYHGPSSIEARRSDIQEDAQEITKTLFRSDSSVRLDAYGREVRSCFLRTPDFLDSLLAIADDLLLLDPSQRTLELRKRLKELDSKMLPSTTIYLPVNNSLHQVWSIVESESIALSTKERVPCIIYLEVTNHDTDIAIGLDQVLRSWYTSERPPQRLNTILDKVSNFTQKGLQKLQHDFEKNQEKIFGPRSIELEDSESLSLLSEHSSTMVDIESPSTPRTTSHDSLQKESLGQWLSSDHRRSSFNNSSDSDGDESYGSTGLPGTNSASDEENAVASSTTSPSLPIVFKENFNAKQERLRKYSTQGANPNWRLLPILIKSNDDLRQEQLASQLIHCMATILSKAKVPVWLYPYEIVALSFRGGIMEAIPDTISIDSLRKNYPHFTDLQHFYKDHFGEPGSDGYENAKANFMESLAAYSIVCFIMQIKDRHNGNILLDNKGHLIHIDFGFFFLSSPGKNSGFESAPFKLTKDFVDLIGGSHSHSFHRFRNLCYRTFLELRKNCFEITLLVQMLTEGNEDLSCFRGRPHDAIRGIQERFRLDLSDKACQEYVNCLIDESIENWTTTCYDRYQRCFVGVM